jgi:RecA-family ATPase
MFPPSSQPNLRRSTGWLRSAFSSAAGGLLVGIGGSSKTRTLYHLAIGAIVGRLPWDWSITQTGSAALVLAEDTGEDVHRTLAATLNAIGATRAERELVERNLHVLALAGKECRLIDVHDGVAKENARHAELLRKLRGYTDLVFVGLDPALAFTAGDELDQAHQRALGRMADSLAVQTGAAVLMTAHSAKGNQNTDELASHSARGGGAITDAVRAEYSLRTMTAAEATKAGITDLEERKRHVQLVATKGNHLPPSAFVPVWLRRGEHGSLYAADVCLDRSNLPKVSDADRRAHGVLVEMSETKAPQLEEWRAECVRIGVVKATAGAAQEKAMQRILDRLLAAGLIKKGTGRGAYLPATQGDEQ